MITFVNGLKINYDYFDEAPSSTLIVLLHGWGCDSKVYTSISQVMAKKYRVLVPNLPGFGGSDEPPEPWSVDDYADFVIELLKSFEYTNVIFAGHSNGGRIIIKLLTERTLSFSVPKIIMTDAAGIKPKKTVKAKLRQRIFKVGKAFYSFRPIKKLFPDSLEKWRKKFGSADYNNATPIMRQTLIKLVNEDQTDKLSMIKASALLIWGENDTATPLSDGQLMEKLIPDAGLVTLKNAGHYSFLDQPHIFCRVLESFLGI